MFAAVYARYSSDLQRDTSIEDQIRSCTALIDQEGWTLVAKYTDHALSGSIRLRPGYQKLLADARSGEFDVVIAEALDRLSRDQEDVAALYKHLSFSGVKLITVGEGEISELHVGLKGTMNALFLKDLKRGLEGRVRQGRSGGGLGYGYDVVREYDSRGELIRGGRKSNEAEAAIVRRIFAEFAAGKSPRAIAKALNAEVIPGPLGRTWGPSTIYGNWRRGTGILNNQLYLGRLVWNRQRFVKDPATGKRMGRLNDEREWVVEDAPGLRIVEDELWHAVKERQKIVRGKILAKGLGVRAERARRPAYLFSGLLRCGECGGGFSKRSQHHYGCSNARNRGICENMLTIRHDVLEASVLAGLKGNLMDPALACEFAAEYHRELNRLNAARDQEHVVRRGEVARVERQIRSLIDAIKEGIRTPAVREELEVLEAKKQELRAALKRPVDPVPRLHPRLSDLYREKVACLGEELNRSDIRTEAAEAIRDLIREIRLVPENNRLEIELVGDLAAIFAFANDSPRRMMPTGVQITMVAGEGFEPPTLGL